MTTKVTFRSLVSAVGGLVAVQSASLPPLDRLAYLVAGVAILVAVTIDLLWTTLWVDGGAGPVSGRLTTWIWRAIRRVGSRNSRLLGLAGPVILTTILATWVALLWGGWTLVFAGGERALLDTRASEPVTWSGRIYYVAYSMFTMGNGDFTPNGGAWQIATALTTASGMLVVTLAVSYVISVLSAVVDKRAFASSVTGVGDRGEAFVRAAWSGDDFSEVESMLDTLATDLGTLAQQHKAYPILHYYHSEHPADASARAVALFDEALTCFRYGVEPDHRPSEAIVGAARSSVESYLRTLNSAFIDPADEPPPAPRLSDLREAGVPVVDDDDFADSVDRLAERRRKLLGVVHDDGWRWPTQS